MTQSKPKLNVFGTKPKGVILCPMIPYNLRNDCQVGQWTNGQSMLGDKLAMTIIAKSEWYGNLGSTTDADWWQLWFVAERNGTAIPVPFETVMVTYIKTESLGNLNTLVTTMMADGSEPAEKVFLPTFIKKSTTLDDGKTANYWAITWECRERTSDDTSIGSLAATIQENVFIDSVGTRKMMKGSYASLVAAGKIVPLEDEPITGTKQQALPSDS
ncbi:hypothetical protein [Okeania sp. SIO2B9]|uniref:hypothetical protein n=1 Tax=Okeania sp. SIO2B9 TaxID=2607782 RepID=UPI00142B5201|nr:hypothetical protein [Okeania sp. SIO2B9]NES89574.1 hypothetical protein [Okeania sp. SIO2B9]